MKNVLITGVNGFIGSALAARLLIEGASVVGIVKDRNFKSRRDILDRISVVYGNIEDYDCVSYAVTKYEIDTIFHLGALAILKIAHVSPSLCYRTNVMGAVNVLEAARCAKHVKKVVFTTSDKAYGNHLEMPYTETMALNASDPYGTSKACADLIAQSYHLTYGLDVCIVRSGNIYGPGDLNLSRLIPGSIVKLLKGEAPVVYSGVEKYRREFMFVDDVIDALVTVYRHGASGEAYNIGGSGFMTVLDTVQAIIDEMGLDKTPVQLDKDFIEIKEQHLDPSKLKALGWQCNYPTRVGIRATWPWYRTYLSNPEKFYFAS